MLETTRLTPGNLRKRREQYAQLPDYHILNIRDLVCAINNIYSDFISGDEIKEVRNATMHSKALVSYENRAASEYIYDFESFDRLATALQTVFRDLRKIRNRAHILERLQEPDD